MSGAALYVSATRLGYGPSFGLLSAAGGTIKAMKTSEQVSADKLRGGFYSPDQLVDVCLDRVLQLLDGREGAALLEPSAGDGAFLRGLERHEVGRQLASVTAIELDPAEAEKARASLRTAAANGVVLAGSVLDPAALSQAHDVAVGNPPFVRFQFLSDDDRCNIERLGQQAGVPFQGVGNLWIPVFLAALNNLRDGGVFSFIVPAECLTGLAARVVRSWLSEHAAQLRVDLFPPKSFPGVLQEVVVLSGQISHGRVGETKVLVHDYTTSDSWRHLLDDAAGTWTGLLLRPEHLGAVTAALAEDAVLPLRDVAKLSVATVTGANDYFCISDPVRQAYALEGWTRSLLDRTRHAEGLEYTNDDHAANVAAGHRTWLLDASLGDGTSAGLEDYVREGEQLSLHTRYKTRIRSPWWRVPVVAPGTLMLSKRSNQHPRLIRNRVGVVTTDTVYQGSPLPCFAGREQDIVASFHNSLTLLTAELNGRSFGGGVLELVPTEIASLALPLAETTSRDFFHLDQLVRAGHSDADALVRATDSLIMRKLELDRDMWRLVADARQMLRDRRLVRSAGGAVPRSAS
jgi:adenine-specific DNA-methyltransferase